MKKIIITEASECINCYREELLIYLVQRFGSLEFAQRVFNETKKRLESSDFLNYVPNPHFYLMSYALSLGLEFMQADMEAQKKKSTKIRLEDTVISARITPAHTHDLASAQL